MAKYKLGQKVKVKGILFKITKSPRKNKQSNITTESSLVVKNKIKQGEELNLLNF